MRVTILPATPRLQAVLATALISAAIVLPAQADSRTPAPIVFKTAGDSARISPERQTVFITPTATSAAPGKAKARIAFTYPGAPAQSAGQAVQPSHPQTAPAKRAYASIDTPIAVQPEPVAVHPTAPKAFDPRAAARRVAAERAQAPVDSESLPALAGAVEKQPEQGGMTQPAPKPATAASPVVMPEPVPVFDQSGTAIVYGDEFHGLPTANGELFSQSELMAAHPNLPLPSLVQVVNIDTNTEVVVRVNDRGPFEDGAMLQLSERAATELGMAGAGRANVRIRYLGPAPAVAPATASMTLVSTSSADADPAEDLSAAPSVQPAAMFTHDRGAPALYQPVSTGTYFVQVGAFSDIANAETLVRTMPAHITTQIDPAHVNGTDFFRVRVGPFISREAADRTQADLGRYGLPQGRIVSKD
ncbi:septal ring lytic transglycosylase RlpA family protein [Hyphomonas sp.]|uniref:septal ring lytic transglycosylase RlpA family protein n=1 Tax=Hyphomonas sp. TaxID=87 RepID=UPI0025BA9EDB|nr:septal ring lytic transglycosylase RlpA family protein [Hyphomonas sp.]